jgi:hypothetical protein
MDADKKEMISEPTQYYSTKTDGKATSIIT